MAAIPIKEFREHMRFAHICSLPRFFYDREKSPATQSS
jgi:hypothetical protein